jgi:hypothetical protein
MKKILLTGMTASHCSKSANQRSLGFSGALNLALSSSKDIDVVWGPPSLAMHREFLEQFDSVLVGVSPLASLSANYTYGALGVISQMKDSPKLSLFVDTSSPRHMALSLNKFSSNVDSFLKPIFDSRKESKQVHSDKKHLETVFEATKFLAEEIWPQTFYASLPWKSVDSLNLPENAKKEIKFINLDSFLIEKPPLKLQRSEKWAVDSYKSRWTKQAISTHSLPDSPMRWNRGVSDSQVMEQICRSMGALISPDDRDGTFWSYRYSQALSSGTPVATYWPESGVLSESWAVLSSKIDTMSSSERDALAKSQKTAYVKNILEKKEALDNLKYFLKVD